MNVSTPSLRWSLFPQHATPPSASHAHEKPRPAPTACAVGRPRTAVAERAENRGLSSVLSLPRAPRARSPQHATPPVVRTAQAWCVPAAICLALLIVPIDAIV